MLRRIIKDVGRFTEGDIHDFPKATWEQIAKDYRRNRIKIRSKHADSWKQTTEVLDKFSESISMEERKAAEVEAAMRREERRAELQELRGQ